MVELNERVSLVERDIAHIKEDIGEIKQDIREIRNRLDSTDGKISSNLKWTAGMVFSTWVTTFLAILYLIVQVSQRAPVN